MTAAALQGAGEAIQGVTFHFGNRPSCCGGLGSIAPRPVAADDARHAMEETP